MEIDDVYGDDDVFCSRRGPDIRLGERYVSMRDLFSNQPNRGGKCWFQELAIVRLPSDVNRAVRA